MAGISILIPTYNAGDYLQQALASIVLDLDVADEVIIQDSLSLDNTETVVRDFSRNVAADVRYFREKDRGQTDALQRGLNRARRPYMVWLNADDRLDGLGTLRARQDDSVDVVCAGFRICDLAGNTLREKPGRALDLRALVRDGCYQFSGAMMFRTDAVRAAGGFDERWNYCMDYDLFLRLANARVTSLAEEEIVATFHIYPESKSGSAQWRFVQESHRLRQLHGSNSLGSGQRWWATTRHALAAATSSMRYSRTYSSLRRIVGAEASPAGR